MQVSRSVRWSMILSLIALVVLAWPRVYTPALRRGHRSGLKILGLSQAEPKARVLHLAYKPIGKCLDLQQSNQDSELLHAVLRKCDFNRILSSQMWVVDPHKGEVRNVLHRGKCLATRQFHELAHFGVETCKPFGAGLMWGFTDKGQLAALTSKAIGLPSTTYCAVPQPDQIQNAEPLLVIQACLSASSPTTQNQWVAVDSSFGHDMLARQRLRPMEAIHAESLRRKAAEDGHSGKLLTIKEMVDTMGLQSSQKENFWWSVYDVFGALAPSWNRWQDVLAFRKTFAAHSNGFAVLSTAVLVNILSNMGFAGMNFIKGSNGEDLDFMNRHSHLPLQMYTNQPLMCDKSLHMRRQQCTFPIPDYSESLEVLPLSEYAAAWKTGPLFRDFKLTTAKKEPSWEDDHGPATALRMAEEGLKAAKAAGMVPSEMAADVRPGFRFAFDLEGLLAMLQEGFYWMTFDQVKYASNGAFGASVVEEQSSGDLLALLMTKSQFAMHLNVDPNSNDVLVADLTGLEQYKPLPGFAPLGGKATFKLIEGNLRTVQLEYNGTVYDMSKADPHADKQFQQSILQGRLFAEKAIIASLLAKTQLLIHVKTIHMELAPTLQAVTINSLSGHDRHPLRQFLEPFVTRNIQATNSNLKVWFDFRGAEFGLAPLSVEEQLRLISDDMKDAPLDLSSLDLERFAEARGWPKVGFMPDWYQRGREVEKIFDALIRDWAQGSFEGDDADLQKDEGVVMWWKSLYEQMPSFKAASEGSEWLTSKIKSTGIDYDVVDEKVKAITGDDTRPLPEPQPGIPSVPVRPDSYWKTTLPPTTTVTTVTITYTGGYLPMSMFGQNPAGLLAPLAAAPIPTQPPTFKDFYSSVRDFEQPQATPKDNFFDMTSKWLPSASRRLASGESEIGGPWGFGREESAKTVTDSAQDLASQMEILKGRAIQSSKGPSDSVVKGIKDLANQMEDLQGASNSVVDGRTSSAVNDFANQMAKLKDQVKVSDSVDKMVSQFNDLKGRAIQSSKGPSDSAQASHAVSDGMGDLASQVESLQGAAADGVSAGIAHLAIPATLLESKASSTTSHATTTEMKGLPPVLMANFPHVLSTSAPSLTTSKMRHASQNKPSASEEELKMELSKLPPLNVETLTRVLRTLLLWTSWIHEDVGHAWASFIYNPVHTPGFVPVDGKGICSPALIYRVAMFRNFVALERNKLTDPIDEMMFSKMICPQGEAATSSDDANPWTSCVEQVNGIVVNAFAQFRRSLDNLDTKEIFTEFAQNGFYSRTRSVESSASS